MAADKQMHRLACPFFHDFAPIFDISGDFTPEYMKNLSCLVRHERFLFCEDRTIEMFLRFRCLDLNTRHNHSASLRFCFQGFYSTISISVPPIKTTLIFSFDSTTTHSMICLTSLSSYSIGWFCSPSSMVKISSSRDLALSLF